MLRPGFNSNLTVLVLSLIASSGLRGEAVPDAPDYHEVREIIRAHLSGVTDAELNRAAVLGLISGLAPKVSLVSHIPATAGAAQTNSPLVGRTALIDEAISYVRVARVEEGLAGAVRLACQSPGASNAMHGVILDLRFASGSDYAAAAATSELFVKDGRPLMDWGAGMAVAKEKNRLEGLPVAVLVNRSTAGAAEALAAVLRKAGGALVLGSKTSGVATMAQEYPLANGDRLRIATKPIELGDGSALSNGVDPDILVRVSPTDEHAYYDDAFRTVTANSLPASGAAHPASANDTNAARRPRLNEKELVREHREELSGDAEPAPRLASTPAAPGADREKPQVHDPALARAIDLLKGLAVVRGAHS